MPAFDYSLVADIYDRYVRTDLDIPFFRDEVLSAGGPVLELMCGTGRLTLPLLKAGAKLTCVDSSADMLRGLRIKLSEQGLSAHIVEQDVTRLKLRGTFALALIPFNSFSEITDVAGQRATFAAIARCLTPGGKLIVTLHNPSVRLRRIDGMPHDLGRFPLDEENATLTLSAREVHDPASNIVTGEQMFEARDAAGNTIWRRDVPIAMRLVSREEFETLALESGFRIESLFGNYDRSPFEETTSPYMIWTLAK